MRSRRGKAHQDQQSQSTGSSFGGTSKGTSSASGNTFDSSDTSDPRFRAPTHSQVNPDDFSIHSSDLSREDVTTTTTTNSSSGIPAKSLPSSAAQNSTSQSPSSTQHSTQSPVRSRRSADEPLASMFNRKRKQQPPPEPSSKPSPESNAANQAIPKRAALPATFINLPKFTKRNDAEGATASPTPISPAFGPASAVAANPIASPPAATPPPARHARFLPDPQMQPPPNPSRSAAGKSLSGRRSNKQGGGLQSALTRRIVSDDEASNSDAAGSHERAGSTMDLDSATDEGDPAQADEIAAIRSSRAAAGHLPPSSDEQGASGSSFERPLSDLLSDRMKTLSDLHRTSSIAMLAQLRRVSGSDEPDGSDRGSDKDMGEDNLAVEQGSGGAPDSSNVKRETSDPNESQADVSVDGSASGVVPSMYDNFKRKRDSVASPSVSVDGGTPKTGHKARKKSREDQFMADYRKRQSRKGGNRRSKQYVWIFPPAWVPGKDVPGQDPPHDGTITLVPQPEGMVDPDDDDKPYKPKYRTKLLAKAPHFGCNDNPEVTVFLGQSQFPPPRPGRDGPKYPANKEKPNRLRNSSVLTPELFATMIPHLAPKPQPIDNLIDLKIVRGPGRESPSTRGSINETDVEDALVEKAVAQPPPARILRAPSQRNRANQRQAEAARQQHPITGLVWPENFEDFVGSKTGGSMFTRSTQNAKFAGTTWEASSRLVQLEGVARSGPVGVMMSSQSTEPIHSFTQSQQHSTRLTEMQNDVPRVGNWVLDPRTAEAVLAASKGRGPQYPEGDDVAMDSAGEGAGDQATSQTPEEQLGAGQQSTQGTALLKPQSAKARQYYATHAQESTHIPDYIKPALIEFLSSEGYKIEPNSRLREKDKWMFDLCAASAAEGENMRLVLIVETSPPSATPHLLNEQICQLLRDDANTSPWRDSSSRQLDSQTGNPVDGSFGVLTVPMDEHAQVQKELETVSGERDDLEGEREKLSWNLRNLKKQKAEVDAKLREFEKQHRALTLKSDRLQAELEAERARVEHLQLQLKKGIQSRNAILKNSVPWLECDNKRLKAQVDVLNEQSAKTDGPIRRKAAEWDAMKAKQAEAAIAQQKSAEAQEKSREARRQALMMALEAAGSPEEKRRAEIMLAALEAPAAPTTNGHAGGVPSGDPAKDTAQGDAVVQTAGQGNVVAPGAPAASSSKNGIEDELAELAAEAAALGEVDPVIPTGGRRSRRSAAAAVNTQSAAPESAMAPPPAPESESKPVDAPAAAEQSAERPTEQPTEQSTEQPTEQPTELPAVQPTEQPADQPTEQPAEASAMDSVSMEIESQEAAPMDSEAASARAFAAAASAPGTAPSEASTSGHPYQTVNPADLFGPLTAAQMEQKNGEASTNARPSE